MSDTLSVNPQRGKAFWLDHVQRWQDSGLSKIAYCKQHNLNASSFYNWSRPVRMQSMAESNDKTSSDQPSARSELEPIAFLPLSVKSSLHDAGKACVQRGGTEVSLTTDLEPAQVQMWLTAIHQLHV